MTDPATRTCPTCGTGYPPDALFCPSDGTPLASPPTPLIGRTLGGRYQITKELGRGGMGHVYLATQLPMKRPCALKVIRPDKGWDPGSVARFHREAENASRISHANVAQVYDSGEADGVAYLAMEYVDGEPLASLLEREGPLPPRRTARIVWQVANALGAAHYLGIVHRDLKPENVMLTRFRDRADFVKVVDFGIAKAPGGEGQQVTSASVVIGTPEYMSPEQFLGGDVDPRSDVYALAMLTIRTMAGALPPIFGPHALLQAAGIPDPVGLGQMKETTTWPEPIRTALNRALARDAKDRTASVDDFFHQFAAAVSRWDPGTGAPEPWEAVADRQSAERARAPTPEAGTPPAPRSRRPLLALGAAVVVVSAVLLGRRFLGGADQAVANPPAPPTAPSTAAAVPDPPPPPATTDAAGGPPASVNPPPPAVARFSAADSLARLDRLTDPSVATAGTARDAVAMYRRLQTRFTGAARSEAAYYAGRGHVRLGQDAEACELFAAAAQGAGGTRFAEPIAALLAGCPDR